MKEKTDKYALKSIQAAITDLKNDNIDVLVTAPVNKNNINTAEFSFTGHTEYLAAQFEAKDYMMLLVSNNLRVGLVTGHVPVSKIASSITEKKILSKLRIMKHSLKIDFGIRSPKIAVLGLNPHAGDNGLLGDEEINIIIPAIKKAKDEGMLAFGPYPTDGFFGSGAFSQFDGILAMYHDQGLAPFKSLSFDSGVNFTAGLPIVRTSPDHGTAYDIAGKNIASERSFRESIYLGCDVLRKREEHEELTSNPLKIAKMKREY